MILFLDFDGVLHPDAAYLVRGRPVLRAEGELFMWADKLIDALAGQHHVRIVLSTSWARELGYSRARDYLPPPLHSLVIGATWHSAMRADDEYRPLGRETWWDRATRYEQIRRYVDRAGVSRWLALDDHPEGWKDIDQERLIRTDPAHGLSDPAVTEKLRTCLGGA